METKRCTVSMINPSRQTRADPQQWAPPFENLNPRPPYWNPPLRRGDRHTCLNAQQKAGEVTISTSITTVRPHSRATAKTRSPSGRLSAISVPGDPCAIPPSLAARTVVTLQPLGASVSYIPPTAKFLTPRSQTARRTELWRNAAGHPSLPTGTTTTGSTTGRTVHRQPSNLNQSTPVAAARTPVRSPGCPPFQTATTTGLFSVSRGTIKGSMWLGAGARSTVHPRPPAPRSRCPEGPLAAPGGPVLLLLHLMSIYALSSIHCLDR